MIFNGHSSFKQMIGGHEIWKAGVVNNEDIPFYVENITNSSETLKIYHYDISRTPTFLVEKSTDGVNWSTLVDIVNQGTATEKLVCTYTLASGSRLYLRAQTSGWGGMILGGGRANNTITGVSRIGGNIMSLLYGANFTGDEVIFPSNTSNIFSSLFSENGFNEHHLRDAKYLWLPSTTLASRCYDGMFNECTLLVNAPVLPATTLVQYCYWYMFAGCTSLNNITCLATNISATGCVDGWVYNVAASGTFIKNPNMSSWTTGDDGIPSGWTVVNG